MKIDSMSELKKLLATLQANGVELYKNDGLELVLRPIPEKSKRASKKPISSNVDTFGEIDESTQIPAPDIKMPDELTEEQLLNWSSTPSVQPSN